MVIVDASAIAPFLLPDESGDQLDYVADVLRDGRCRAPALLFWELANLIWKACRTGRMTEAERHCALDSAQLFSIASDPVSPDIVFDRTVQLSLKHDLTAYDAAYLELALRCNAALVTFDKSLRQAALAEATKVFPTS